LSNSDPRVNLKSEVLVGIAARPTAVPPSMHSVRGVTGKQDLYFCQCLCKHCGLHRLLIATRVRIMKKGQVYYQGSQRCPSSQPIPIIPVYR